MNCSLAFYNRTLGALLAALDMFFDHFQTFNSDTIKFSVHLENFPPFAFFRPGDHYYLVTAFDMKF